MTSEECAKLYWQVKREPKEGTIRDAITAHAQACGFVAYVADVHPDAVARAVRDYHGLRALARATTE